MRKTILMGALALALAGGAGAQTTSCTPIPDPVVPQFITGGWTKEQYDPSTGITQPERNGSAFNFLSDTDAEYSGGKAETLLYNDDGTGRRLERIATSPTITINNVRFLQVGFVFANYGREGGSSTVFDFKYNGVTYATITSPGPNDADLHTARVVGVNGGTVYDENGVLQSVITTTDKTFQTGRPIDNAIVNTTAGYELDVSLRKMFYIRLPDNVAPTGQLVISKRAEVNPPTLYGDDFRIWLPRALSTSLCLQKKLDVGVVPNSFQFTTTGTDNSLVSTSATGPITIPVADTTNKFSKAPNSGSGPNALIITNPASITITENAPGFTITKVDCDRPAYRDGSTTTGKAPTPGNNVVSLNGNVATITSLTIGQMTTCTFYNTDSTQVAYPRFTLVKNFTGFQNASDRVNISISEAGGGSSNTAVANTGTRTGSTTYTGTRLLFGTSNTTSNTVASGVPPVFTLGETFVTGSATNYARTYSCTNATTGSTTTLVTTSTALPAGGSITIQPAQGDNITCTFVNNLTVAPPTTNVNVTKDGLKIVTAGTAVTYSITAQNTTATAVDVVLTDQFNPVLPAGQVTSVSDGGTYNATTGLVTWPRVNLPANGSVTRTVTVDVPDPVQDAANGDSYSGPNQVTDTANLTAYTVGTGTSLANNGTSSASVTTNHLFAQVRKTVRNVTRGGAAGTSADAQPGDILEYCLNYTNQSAIPLDSMTVRDTLTAGQTLLTSVYSGETLSLTRGGGTAQPTANSGSATTVSTTLTNVAAGETGQLCFQTQTDS